MKKVNNETKLANIVSFANVHIPSYELKADKVTFRSGNQIYTVSTSDMDNAISDYKKTCERTKTGKATKQATEKVISTYNLPVSVSDLENLFHSFHAYMENDFWMEKELSYLTKEAEKQESVKKALEKDKEGDRKKIFSSISSYVRNNNSLPDLNKVSQIISECHTSYTSKNANALMIIYKSIAEQAGYNMPCKKPVTVSVSSSVSVIPENPNKETEADKKALISEKKEAEKEQIKKQLEAMAKKREELLSNDSNVITLIPVSNGLNVYDKACKAWTYHVALYFNRRTIERILSIRWNVINKHYTKEIETWKSACDYELESGNEAKYHANLASLSRVEAEYNNLLARYEACKEQAKSIWNMNEADRRFNKAIKANFSVYEAIRIWFREFGFDVSETGKFMKRLVNDVSTRKNASADKMLTGTMKQVNNKALYELYHSLNEILIKAGISRKAGIPDDIMLYLESRQKDSNKEYTFADIPVLSFDDIAPTLEAISNEVALIDKKCEALHARLKMIK